MKPPRRGHKPLKGLLNVNVLYQFQLMNPIVFDTLCASVACSGKDDTNLL